MISIRKKLGLFLVILVLSLVSLVSHNRNVSAASAAPTSQADIVALLSNPGAIEFVNAVYIKATIAGKDYYFEKDDIYKTDFSGNNATNSYSLIGSECNGKVAVDAGAQNNIVGVYDLVRYPNIQAYIDIQYKNPVTGDCTSINYNGGSILTLTIPTKNLDIYYEYTSDNSIMPVWDKNATPFRKAPANYNNSQLWYQQGACPNYMIVSVSGDAHTLYKLKGGSGAVNEITANDLAIITNKGTLTAEAFNNDTCAVENTKPLAKSGQFEEKNGNIWVAKTFPLGNVAGKTGVSPSTPPGANEIENTCESSSGSMGWALCPFIDLIDGGLEFFEGQITQLLSIDKNKYSNDGLKAAWVVIRNISYAILIPVMLVMVIGTALGVDRLNAYTVKKALPRMVMAVMFITFSWYICQYLVNFFNVVGSGVVGLLTSPFSDSSGNAGTITLGALLKLPDTSQGGVFGGLTNVALLAGTAVAFIGLLVFLIFFGFTLVLGIGVAFLVLLIRQMFILGLILLAPLAILAWIFPGNDKLWKSWWNGFTKLLIMFPMIMGIVAVGKIFAWIIAGPGSVNVIIVDPTLDKQILAKVINIILVIGAFLIPYFFIPFAFKAAGGVFANLTGMLNDKNKGLFDRARKRRGSKWERWKAGNAFKGASQYGMRGTINRGIENVTGVGKAGIDPRKMRARMQIANSEARLHHAEEMAEKDPLARTFFQNDDLIMAGLYGARNESSARAYLISKGQSGIELDRNVARVTEMRRRMGAEAFNIAGLLKAPATGTAFAGATGAGDWHRAIASVTNGDLNLAGTLIAKGRAGFRSASRYDISESGFGDNITVQTQIASGAITVRHASEKIYDSAYINGGPAAVVNGRKSSIENMANVINKRIDKAEKELNDATLKAKAMGKTEDEVNTVVSGQTRALKSELASLAGILDAMGSAKPDARRILADRTLGVLMLNGTKTRKQYIDDDLRTDKVFGEFRREYANAALENMEKGVNQVAAKGQQVNASIPPTPGTPTPSGP